MLRSGCCTDCGADLWKAVAHPQTKARILLWPRPHSKYAVISLADGSVSRGIAYCAGCGPEIGAPAPEGLTTSGVQDGQRITTPVEAMTVLAYESAQARYRYRLSDEYGAFLRAWLADELNLDILGAGTIKRTIEEWEKDRVAA